MLCDRAGRSACCTPAADHASDQHTACVSCLSCPGRSASTAGKRYQLCPCCAVVSSRLQLPDSMAHWSKGPYTFEGQTNVLICIVMISLQTYADVSVTDWWCVSVAGDGQRGVSSADHGDRPALPVQPGRRSSSPGLQPRGSARGGCVGFCHLRLGVPRLQRCQLLQVSQQGLIDM